MKLKQFYLYLVAFATLMMTIGGSVGVVMKLADYLTPYHHYETFASFKEMRSYDEKGEKPKKLSESEVDELRTEYDDMIVDEETRVKAESLNGMVKSFAWILIPFPLFWVTRRHLKKLSE